MILYLTGEPNIKLDSGKTVSIRRVWVQRRGITKVKRINFRSIKEVMGYEKRKNGL